MISNGGTNPARAKVRPIRKAKKRAAPASKSEIHTTVNLAPLVVKAGSRSRSSLRHLEQGSGPLVHEIDQIVRAIHAAVTEPVPITIVYREKWSRGSRSDSLFGMFF